MPVRCHALRAQQGLTRGGSGHLPSCASPASPGQPLGCKQYWPLWFSHCLTMTWSRSPVTLGTVPQGHCPASCDSLGQSLVAAVTLCHTHGDRTPHRLRILWFRRSDVSSGSEGWRVQKRIRFPCLFQLPKAICVLLAMAPSTAFRARVASSNLSEICLHVSFSDFLPPSLSLFFSIYLVALGVSCGTQDLLWYVRAPSCSMWDQVP